MLRGLESRQVWKIMSLPCSSTLPRTYFTWCYYTSMRKPHQFRFQVFHHWLISTYPPCQAADIGGGKGLLTYLLNQAGWQTTVIDPTPQSLQHKFKDLASGKRVKLSPQQITSVPRISLPFAPQLAQNFDLLIGLHAHGSNLHILSAAKTYSKDFAILPCCVIDEPLVKKSGVNWFDSLVTTASNLKLNPKIATLNFVGQNQVIYTQNHLR